MKAVKIWVGIVVLGWAAVTVAKVQVNRISFRGWENAVELRNDTVRMVVVPAIGRIMHYGFLNSENLLYTNPEMGGLVLKPGEIFKKGGKPANLSFGGDRLVALPENFLDQALGSRINTDPWTDGRPHACRVGKNSVEIVSPVSRLFGIKMIRKISLEPHGTSVKIEQRMVKVRQADSAELDRIPLTLWNLTQINPPEQTWQPVAENSVFKDGTYIPLWSIPRVKGNYSVQDGMVRLTPRKKNGQKIGTDSRGWVAGWTGRILLVERFNYVEGAVYPEGGTSTAVYTNPTFSELECLSPQKVLAVGESIDYTIRWELYYAADEQAAKSILKLF